MESLLIAVATLVTFTLPVEFTDDTQIDQPIEQTEVQWSGCTADGNLRLNADGTPFEAPIIALGNNTAVSAEVTPGVRCFRARSYVAGVAGEWSSVHQTTIADGPAIPVIRIPKGPAIILVVPQ